MKEIIGDDHPTYEDSVNMTLAEQKNKPNYTYMTEIEQQITKENMERLMMENLQLRHRLSCIKDDIAIIDRHITNTCAKQFAQPSRSTDHCKKYEDNEVYADEAIHNITNIEIACDLNDDEPLHWGSKVMAEAKGHLDEDPVFEGHSKHMEASGDYLDKYIAKK